MCGQWIRRRCPAAPLLSHRDIYRVNVRAARRIESTTGYCLPFDSRVEESVLGFFFAERIEIIAERISADLSHRRGG